MTSEPDSSVAPVTVRMDGIDANALSAIHHDAEDSSNSTGFWSSARRVITSNLSEVMEVSFGSKRLVNYLGFQLSHFPLVVKVEYLNDTGQWLPVTYAKTTTTNTSGSTGRQVHQTRVAVDRTLEVTLQEVVENITDSIPARVDTGSISTSQHSGEGHWVEHSMAVTPVLTSGLRFILSRNPNGVPPRDSYGRPVDYSLAIRNLQIGYRVFSKEDIPTPVPDAEWWASSRDILGSRTVYSTYLQDSRQAIDGDTSTFWRSEPQPFPFAVVNLFLDLRDDTGTAPVVDRFWVDPVTIGPMCNVYYSNSDPVGEFDGLSRPLPDQWKTEIGNPGTTVDRASGRLVSIDLGPDLQSGFVASNVYERIHYDQPWWVGIDARSLVAADDPNSRPLLSMGTVRIVQEDTALKVIAPTGQIAQIDLDPALHRTNTHYRVVAAYFGADVATGRNPYLHLAYRLGDLEPVFIEVAIPPLAPLDVPVKIGLHPDPASTDIPALGVLGIVVKSESMTPEAEEWFFDEGAEFVADPSTPRLNRGTAQNARLRMHPMFRSANSNLFGVVGGPGNRFDEMEWTPVTRDYTLRRGYLHLPPTRAKYWKFEMTRLLPQVYENFVTINREALVFPPDIVDGFNKVAGGKTSTSVPAGMNTVASASDNLTYSDALQQVQTMFSADAASALVLKDPNMASEAAKSGWIWTYQPWHLGSSAPQFVGTQVHRYEAIRVQHSTKVAFFAGIREITPFRVDYTFDDDTPEYIEHMLDSEFLDLSQTSNIRQEEGSLYSVAETGEVVSKALRSYRNVRGVQFATQETDAVQVLEDSDFIANDLTRWREYGDAKISRIGPSNVAIDRGWFATTWGHLEAQSPTWGDLEGSLWGALEGNDPVTGFAEGGILSTPYTPKGAGKVTAQVKISSTDSLSGPIQLEILAANDNTVLASSEHRVQQGDSVTMSVSYPNARLETKSGGAVHQRTWGDLENSLGVYSIPANGAATVAAPGAVVGATPFDDTDDATYATSTSTSGGTLVTGISTVLPAAPAVPPRLTSIKINIRATADVATDVRGHLTLKRTSNGAVINDLHFDLAETIVAGELTLLAPATPTGAADLSTAIREGATVEMVIDSLGGAMPTADRTMTVYELSVTASENSLWGDLERYKWGGLEAYTDEVVVEYLNPDLVVRVRQKGNFRDTFHVHRIGLYETPIAWFFSNDDGTTWWEAVDVRNDPHGVMLFPKDLSGDPLPTTGKALRWKAKFFKQGVTLNALHIRPWYGTHSRTTDGAHTMEAMGPNQSIYDNMPSLQNHPMWTPRLNLVERIFRVPPEPVKFWRNLIPTPSGESPVAAFDTTGGTVETQADWIALIPDPGA